MEPGGSQPPGKWDARPEQSGRVNSILPYVAGALAVGIFLIDTLTSLEFAVAVLYVVVVLLTAARFERRGVIIAACCCVALTLVSYVLTHGFELHGTAPLRSAVSLAAIAIATVLALQNLAANVRLRRTERERANLARFFPPQVVDQLVHIDSSLSIARYQPAAVLFVDMIESTAYCSGKSPEEVIALLRDLLALLSDSVFSHRGSIDKFLGDGLMAVFGPPLPSSHDATDAALCAVDIVSSIDRWNAQRDRSEDGVIRVAVGIHYGDVVQGDVGSDRQLELTVVGETVNIASRVEAYSRSLNAAVLVTAALIAALHEEGSDDVAALFEDEGLHVLRGRSDPIHVYGVKRGHQEPLRRAAAIAKSHARDG
jgi:class 3 adenylate cyclase